MHLHTEVQKYPTRKAVISIQSSVAESPERFMAGGKAIQMGQVAPKGVEPVEVRIC